MAYDQLMHTYMSYGPVNDMPPSPNVAPGVAAFYYTTDTALLYVWSGIGWVPASGGGSTAALTKISETVLASTAATINFSNIPATYRHLQIVFMGRAADVVTDRYLYIRFNNDTGAHYYDQRLYANGTTVAAGQTEAQTNAAVADLTAASDANSLASGAVIDIPDYATTTWEKVALGRSTLVMSTAAAGMENRISGVHWANTAAINQITLYPQTGNFVAGTIASLYALG